MKTLENTKFGSFGTPSYQSLAFVVCFLAFFVFLGGCGVYIATNKETLAAGDSMFLRGFGEDASAYVWRVEAASDTLENLKITFRQAIKLDGGTTDGGAADRRAEGFISSCEFRELCAIQRGKDAPSGTLIISLTSGSSSAKTVIELPAASSTVGGSGTEAEKEPTPTVEAKTPDAGSID